MVQILPEEGNVFGRLGKGLGQGISQQLPKEIERGRLASGLSGLAQQTGNPVFNQIAQLQSIPGISENPQLMQSLLPYLQGQGGLQEARKGPPPGTAASQPSSGSGLGGGMPGTAEESPRLAGTTEGLQQRALELNRLYPVRFPNIEAATAQAEKEFGRQEDLLAKTGSEYDTMLEKYLQKQGGRTFADVFGTQQDAFKKQAEEAVLSGKMTDKQAARHFGQQALNFAETRQRLKNIGVFSEGSRAGKTESFGQIRDEYKKLGRLKEFRDDLRTFQGLSKGASSYLAYPSENVGIGKAIKEATSAGSKIKGIFADQKIAEKVAKNITPQDSLQSISFRMKENGLNPQKFMSDMNRLYNEGKVQLTEQQAKELQDPIDERGNLNDLYYFAFGGVK